MKPIWPLLFVAIVVAFWLFCWKYGWRSFMEMWHENEYGSLIPKFFAGFIAVMTTALMLLVCVGAGAIGFGVARMVGGAMPQVWHECWRSQLVSMRNADGETGSIKGSVFLIAGSIGQSSTYFYYTTTSDGGFRQQKWTPNNDTTIYEEDRAGGEVVQFDEQLAKPWMAWFGEADDRLRMDFYVPVGSVQKQFVLK